MDAVPDASERPPIKRRIKLIRPRLQLKMTCAFGSLLLLSLLANSMLTAVVLAHLAESLPSDSAFMAEVLPGLLARTFLGALLLVLPALLLIGVRTTFRVAGPVHRLETHLSKVAAGLKPAPCHLREGDDLQELCQLVNEALAVARSEGAVESSDAGSRAA